MHPAIITGIVRSLIVDVAMGQIPRSTERISSSSKNDRKVKNKKKEKNAYGEQSALNCSYTALTAACRGPNTQRKQSSAE